MENKQHISSVHQTQHKTAKEAPEINCSKYWFSWKKKARAENETFFFLYRTNLQNKNRAVAGLPHANDSNN